jgi:hypothetical protein
MYKNLIGLNKVNVSKPNPNKKKKQMDAADTRSENSILIEDYFGTTNQTPYGYSNNDLDNDEYAEFYTGGGEMIASGKSTAGSENVVFKYGGEDDEDEQYDNFEYGGAKRDETDELAERSNVRVGSEIRIDLINEINDEFLEDEVSPGGSTSATERSNQAASVDKFSAEFARAYSHDEDEEDDYYKDDSQSAAAGEDGGDINLNNLQIAIDEIEELVDKSNNKTCFVLAIKVWNLEVKYGNQGQQAGLEEAAFAAKPSWIVKRKYDEFYVLDSRLKEFHGGLITSSEFNVKNPHKITVQLPTKQRALFFINNTNNFEFLHSIKDDFAKYLQVL